MPRPKTSSPSSFTSAISSTRSSGIPRTERRATTAPSTRSHAFPTARRSAISTSPSRWTATERSTAVISATPTCRTLGRAGRSSACGTTTNSRGRDGKASLKAGGPERPGQSVKVAANQAWFEYIPARVARPKGSSLERFDPPSVKNVPIERFDENGLGDEPNNLIAIRSLTGYRALRYGRHLDLMITDQHSYRSKDPTDHPELDKLGGDEFMGMFPEDAMQILDGGRVYNGGNPPAEIRFEASVANPRKNLPPQTILGAEQKAWFKDRLRRSTATWKIWGNSLGTLDERADPQNLPPGLTKPWPSDAFASHGGRRLRHGLCGARRDLRPRSRRQDHGFAIVSGDRHSFWAGYAAKALPPKAFEPVGLSFVGASLASCGAIESYEHRLPKDHPLQAAVPGRSAEQGQARARRSTCCSSTVSARASITPRTAISRAPGRCRTRPSAPHLSFVDLSAHGYAKVRLDGRTMRSEFVCIPRPIARSATPGWRPAALSRRSYGNAVAAGRTSEIAAGSARRRSGTGVLAHARRSRRARRQSREITRCPVAQIWSGREDLNLRPLAPQASALPGCATPRPERKPRHVRGRVGEPSRRPGER